MAEEEYRSDMRASSTLRALSASVSGKIGSPTRRVVQLAKSSNGKHASRSRIGGVLLLASMTSWLLVESTRMSLAWVAAPVCRGSVRPGERWSRGARCGRAATEEDQADLLLKQAEQLRREAEDAEAEARKFRQQREAQDPKNLAAKEVADVKQQLEVLGPKLKKAEAFLLPERDDLRAEFASLEKQLAELEATPAPAPTPLVQASSPQTSQPVGNAKQTFGYDSNGKEKLFGGKTYMEWEELADKVENMGVDERFELGQTLQPECRRYLDEIAERREKAVEAEKQKVEERRREIEEEENEKRVAEAKDRARELRSKLTWEKLGAMSNEERFDLASKLGNAFFISLALVAFAYWTVTLPVFAYAYHEATGVWPGITDLFDATQGATAAGAVAGIVSLALLLKPVRFLVALLLTPWTVENVVPYMPAYLTGDSGNDAGKK